MIQIVRATFLALILIAVVAAGVLAALWGNSPLASATRYALTPIERLRPDLDHGPIELNHSAAERGKSAIALGRRNCLFVGTEAGGKAAAGAYTLIKTARIDAVDPQARRADTLAV